MRPDLRVKQIPAQVSGRGVEKKVVLNDQGGRETPACYYLGTEPVPVPVPVPAPAPVPEVLPRGGAIALFPVPRKRGVKIHLE